LTNCQRWMLVPGLEGLFCGASVSSSSSSEGLTYMSMKALPLSHCWSNNIGHRLCPICTSLYLLTDLCLYSTHIDDASVGRKCTNIDKPMDSVGHCDDAFVIKQADQISSVASQYLPPDLCRLLFSADPVNAPQRSVHKSYQHIFKR